MKTRLLIIIGMIIAITISVSALIIIDNIERTPNPPSYLEPQVIFENFNEEDDPLEMILDNCYAQKNNLPHHQPLLRLTNGTHYINNNTCEWQLEEKDPNPTQLGGPIIIPVDPAPEPPPSPSKCKSGPASSDEHYFDEDACEWYLIQEPRVGDVFPHIWNAYLHKNSIDFSPQERSYANNEPGFDYEKENRVCSSLIAADGTEFYISSTFTIEPFEIIATVITQTQPEECQRILKTDVILVEPTPELWGWLENYYDENEN